MLLLGQTNHQKSIGILKIFVGLLVQLVGMIVNQQEKPLILMVLNGPLNSTFGDQNTETCSQPLQDYQEELSFKLTQFKNTLHQFKELGIFSIKENQLEFG